MPSPAEAADAPVPASGVLCVVGDLVEDVVVWAAEPLRRATDTAAQVFRTRGGSAANTAAAAAGLVPTRFIGCVGADGAGDALAAELAAGGVDVRLQRRGRTGAVVLLVEPDGERHMFPDRAAAAELGSVEPSWLDDVAVLHLPAYGLERDPARSAIVELAARARAGCARISVDASSTGLIAGIGVAGFVELLAAIAPDVCFANAEEAAVLGLGTGGAADDAAGTVVVKRGADPAEVFASGRLAARVPATPVSGIRDSTGAGDAFAAGYLAAWIGGADPAAACAAGHRAAARTLASPGAALAPATPSPAARTLASPGAALAPSANSPASPAPSGAPSPDVTHTPSGTPSPAGSPTSGSAPSR